MVEHHLKTWPKYFAQVTKGVKPFEVRKNDRGFKTGDVLVLEEWDPIPGNYTGNHGRYLVSCLLDGGQFGIQEGYCVMGLKCISSITELNKQPGYKA